MFSIYDKMQVFVDESGLFIFFILFYFFFFFFCILRGNSRWPPKVVGKQFGKKSSVDSADTLRVKNFVEITISLRFRDKRFFAFYAEIGGKTIIAKSRQ